MSHVLSGVDLKDLGFVGILEHLNKDLDYLANMMGWKNYRMPQINVNTAFKAKYPAPTDQEVEQIRGFFQADIELYYYALELRKLRSAEQVLGNESKEGMK